MPKVDGKALMVWLGDYHEDGPSRWADRIGYSFSWGGKLGSKWGSFSAPVKPPM